MNFARISLWVLSLGLVLTACVPNRMYRRDSVEVQPDYTLAFLEFDDQGEMWSPAQLRAVLQQIEKANEHPEGASVVLFIHGWHHNASPRDEQENKGNIRGFKALLEDAVRDSRRRGVDSSRPTIGIYFGWRGEASRWPILKSLSFYGRGRAAKRVANVSATEAIVQVLTSAKENPKTKAVLIGHSFGGRILEKALAQVLAGGALGAQRQEVRFPADAIILVNPASQALMAKQLVEAFARERVKLYRIDDQGRKFERPLMVSVTSEGDWATRLMFPLGLTLPAVSGNFRDYEGEVCVPMPGQRSFFRKTAGHMPALHSHRVKARPIDPGSSDDDSDRSVGVERTFDEETQQWAYSFRGREREFVIEKKPRAWNDTPYWIMRVPRSLIRDHSDIFHDDTVRLITAILEITGALEPETRTVLVREHGVRPLGLVPSSAGGVFFANKDGGVYRLDPGAVAPGFLGCLPSTADPTHRIGYSYSERGVIAALNEPIDDKEEDTYRTEVVYQLAAGGKLSGGRLARFESEHAFVTAAFDESRDRAFLATARPPRIFLLDLTKKRAKPRLWAELPDAGSIGTIFFDAANNRLYSGYGERGTLHAVDAGSSAPRPRRVAEGLGSPGAMAMAPSGRTLFVCDARGGQIWKLDCSTASGCTEASVFTTRTFVAPSSIAVAADDTVWVGDLEEQKIVGFTPGGEIKQVVDRMLPE